MISIQISIQEITIQGYPQLKHRCDARTKSFEKL
jgi:hypothetical protein